MDFAEQGFTGLDLVNVAWSLATARHWSPKMADLDAAVVKDGGIGRLSPRRITTLLWSCAALDFCPTGILAKQLSSSKGMLLNLLHEFHLYTCLDFCYCNQL